MDYGISLMTFFTLGFVAYLAWRNARDTSALFERTRAEKRAARAASIPAE